MTNSLKITQIYLIKIWKGFIYVILQKHLIFQPNIDNRLAIIWQALTVINLIHSKELKLAGINYNTKFPIKHKKQYAGK